MRKRRGDAPYGHTQALTIAWPRNLHLSRARMLAAQRMRPALTAGPAVWRHWDEHKSKIKFAAWVHCVRAVDVLRSLLHPVSKGLLVGLIIRACACGLRLC